MMLINEVKKAELIDREWRGQQVAARLIALVGQLQLIRSWSAAGVSSLMEQCLASAVTVLEKNHSLFSSYSS